MIGWRLLPKKHQRDAFTGEGARIAPGRWNNRGTRAVYLSGSLSLAALEVLLYTGRAALSLPYVVFRVDIPDALATDTLPVEKLPVYWRQQPPPEVTRRLGSDWIARGAALALRVPSAVIPEEWDIVLNPIHPDFGKIKISKPQAFHF